MNGLEPDKVQSKAGGKEALVPMVGPVRGRPSVGKDVVLYMSGTVPGEKACGDCLWFSPIRSVCALHGDGVAVTETSSCGFYVWDRGGGPAPLRSGSFVTPAVSGLVHTKGLSTCSACRFYNIDAWSCIVVDSFGAPDAGFIHPGASCNAWKSASEGESV